MTPRVRKMVLGAIEKAANVGAMQPDHDDGEAGEPERTVRSAERSWTSQIAAVEEPIAATMPSRARHIPIA